MGLFAFSFLIILFRLIAMNQIEKNYFAWNLLRAKAFRFSISFISSLNQWTWVCSFILESSYSIMPILNNAYKPQHTIPTIQPDGAYNPIPMQPHQPHQLMYHPAQQQQKQVNHNNQYDIMISYQWDRFQPINFEFIYLKSRISSSILKPVI